MSIPISAESCKFTKCLKSRREEEGSEFELECAVESEEGDVTWFFNDIEITPTNNPNFHNFEFIKEGKKRSVTDSMLIILSLSNVIFKLADRRAVLRECHFLLMH